MQQLGREARREDAELCLTKSQSSSLRKQGPIRRGDCLGKCCSPAFAQQREPVVMGPCFRRDDSEDRVVAV